jgi:hypothetical protein
MSENPEHDGAAPEGRKSDSGSRTESPDTAVDPDFVPDSNQSTPEEKKAREKPEETGS